MFKNSIFLIFCMIALLNAKTLNKRQLDEYDEDEDEDDYSDQILKEAYKTFSWIGIIQYENSEGGLTQGCVASLLGERVALTAAHCVTGSRLETYGTPKNILFGEYNKEKDIDCFEYSDYVDCSKAPAVVGIRRIAIHPDYKQGPLERNDLAVIHLIEDVPEIDSIETITIAEQDYTSDTKTEGVMLPFAGWGTVPFGRNTTVKMETETPFVDADDCQDFFDENMPGVTLWEGQVCAGNDESIPFCQEDSGTALLYRNKRNITHLFAVSSFGFMPCTIIAPTVYTKVYHYRNWIKDEMLSLD